MENIDGIYSFNFSGSRGNVDFRLTRSLDPSRTPDYPGDITNELQKVRKAVTEAYQEQADNIFVSFLVASAHASASSNEKRNNAVTTIPENSIKITSDTITIESSQEGTVQKISIDRAKIDTSAGLLYKEYQSKINTENPQNFSITTRAILETLGSGKNPTSSPRIVTELDSAFSKVSPSNRTKLEKLFSSQNNGTPSLLATFNDVDGTRVEAEKDQVSEAQKRVNTTLFLMGVPFQSNVTGRTATGLAPVTKQFLTGYREYGISNPSASEIVGNGSTLVNFRLNEADEISAELVYQKCIEIDDREKLSEDLSKLAGIPNDINIFNREEIIIREKEPKDNQKNRKLDNKEIPFLLHLGDPLVPDYDDSAFIRVRCIDTEKANELHQKWDHYPNISVQIMGEPKHIDPTQTKSQLLITHVDANKGAIIKKVSLALVLSAKDSQKLLPSEKKALWDQVFCHHVKVYGDGSNDVSAKDAAKGNFHPVENPDGRVLEELRKGSGAPVPSPGKPTGEEHNETLPLHFRKMDLTTLPAASQRINHALGKGSAPQGILQNPTEFAKSLRSL